MENKEVPWYIRRRIRQLERSVSRLETNIFRLIVAGEFCMFLMLLACVIHCYAN